MWMLVVCICGYRGVSIEGLWMICSLLARSEELILGLEQGVQGADTPRNGRC